jgi:hypothetical protein
MATLEGTAYREENPSRPSKIQVGTIGLVTGSFRSGTG